MKVVVAVAWRARPSPVFSPPAPGGRDTLADPADVAQLVAAVGHEASFLPAVDTPRYTHMDFVWGLDCGYGIYPQVARLVQQYAPAA